MPARHGASGSTGHRPAAAGSIYFKAPSGEGPPWKRVLRRASTEEEARRIFAQAEAALDTEQATPAGPVSVPRAPSGLLHGSVTDLPHRLGSSSCG